MIEARTPLREIPSIGPRRSEALARQGLDTVEDLLFVLPFRYEDRRNFSRIAQLTPSVGPTVLDVRVKSSRLIRTRRRGFTIFEARLTDSSGEIRAVWFNQPYLARVLVAARRLIVYGRASIGRYGREMILEGPEYELLDSADAEGVHMGRIVPVYRKLADLSTRPLRSLLFRILSELDPGTLQNPIPAVVVSRQKLLPRIDAFREIHTPPETATFQELEERQSRGYRTLTFEEIFLLQLAMAIRRRDAQRAGRALRYEVTDALRRRLSQLLPFRLTQAQRRVLREIRADLESAHPMNRLLQGDVGSGKTIVALLTMILAVENGAQAALMAPTEILAEQHFRSFERILAAKGAPYKIALLTGSVRAAGRRAVLARLASGDIQILVGTHALFEKKVEFHRLGLVVVDEQHRFGVVQRAALAEKGPRPDVLVMTATPIPRSLALTLYGDLDLSVLDELPPGRQPVTTVVRGEGERVRVYAGIRQAVARGRQAFVVVPLVEESAESDRKAAVSFARELERGALAGISVGLVHGRLKGPEKDAVMRSFAAGEIAVLVATTVVEVGVDVPNATVMVVEHAERFGLSQLHQLRGRVGRGSRRSYCVLMVGDDAASQVARGRLDLLAKTNDGFAIAEADLRIRGPGAVFGTWQHGLSDLQFLAAAVRDPGLVEAARAESLAWLNGPDGSLAKAQAILSQRGTWSRRLELAQVG